MSFVQNNQLLAVTSSSEVGIIQDCNASSLEKNCTKCSKNKPISNFHNDRSRKDGKFPHCKECRSNETKEYNKNNSEAIKKYHKEYYEKNKEVISEKEKIKYPKKKQKVLARIKAWRKTDSGKASRASEHAKRRSAEKNITSKEEQSLIKELYTLAQLFDMHVDHYIPLSKGGDHSLSNLQILSAEENLKKGSKMPKEIRL